MAIKFCIKRNKICLKSPGFCYQHSGNNTNFLFLWPKIYISLTVFSFAFAFRKVGIPLANNVWIIFSICFMLLLFGIIFLHSTSFLIILFCWPFIQTFLDSFFHHSCNQLSVRTLTFIFCVYLKDTTMNMIIFVSKELRMLKFMGI